MAEQKRQGMSIFHEINVLQTELSEINSALDDLDKHTLPYRLLKAAADKKREELQAAQTRCYVPSE
jgi:hypothetical protein